ncbi:hypothetical protein HJC23_000681 [Cyclotella cryptica]|uniref:Uncharacterized protein n=1 Tax=Cyclotella cryptica TaxID=29204 RepID=A0ABD3Q9B4_9STRA
MNQHNAKSFKRSLTRHCTIHPEVELYFTDAKCLKCTASLMKGAAKESDFSTVKLDRCQSPNRYDIDSKNSHKSSERKLMCSVQQSDVYDIDHNVPVNTERYDQDSFKSSSPKALRRRFDLGEVAGTFDTLPTDQESLIRIARLEIGDGAFVRRSDNVWTYARLKSREHGPDASLVFTVAARGATKSFPVSYWSQYIRLAAESNHTKEDACLSDLHCEINTKSDVKGSGCSSGKSEYSLSSSVGHETSSSSHESDAISNSPIPSLKPSRAANGNRRSSYHVMKTHSEHDLRQTMKQHRKVKSETNRNSKSNDVAPIYPGRAAESFCSALKLIHTTTNK